MFLRKKPPNCLIWSVICVYEGSLITFFREKKTSSFDGDKKLSVFHLRLEHT